MDFFCILLSGALLTWLLLGLALVVPVLLEAWSAADGAGINAAWRSATSGDSVSAAFMQRVLLGKRNPEMAANIERIMQQDKVAFVGVGLLHLVGEDGLPQLLKRRGYQVEQLY